MQGKQFALVVTQLHNCKLQVGYIIIFHCKEKQAWLHDGNEPQDMKRYNDEQ